MMSNLTAVTFSILSFVAPLSAVLSANTAKSGEPLGDSQISNQEIIDSLTTHCGACHAAGINRFIRDELTANANVQWLRNTESRLTSKTWAESIVETISWPGDRMPANDDRVDEQRRYMPYGAAKVRFHEAKIRGTALRLLLIENL